MPPSGSPRRGTHRERQVDPLLAVDHDVIQVDDPARAVVMAFILGVVAEVAVRDVDLRPKCLVVAQFVDGVGHGVGLDDEEQRRVRAADLDQPRLAEPVARIEDGDVGQGLWPSISHEAVIVFTGMVFPWSSVVAVLETQGASPLYPPCDERSRLGFAQAARGVGPLDLGQQQARASAGSSDGFLRTAEIEQERSSFAGRCRSRENVTGIVTESTGARILRMR